ncbi:hypothetical protein GCM10010512_04660 [Streptomyces thermoviolaceus subsp. thermoviolaceus]|uniref:Uncharacterized protein n=1 Tax=Streptomyces thermoviolaceus subsp. thermoviolaceus TaxID=66860 RepID=A0ABX0YQG0_STRTL|nr:hypothetical protein [Streptomyces thermoviolaceus]NJP13399.1 hypothetical protein [Streptomyces thermoviolaceus subsp. thermoviolaceus]WTD46434.1 hypothetical protein OG899_02225 [Streptomyces thermoviolaceus]GHA77168.1 hypothetical protein GCM10010512_04660 [Streptomyces thermoviolaceus subsp. thermoviolaceus]
MKLSFLEPVTGAPGPWAGVLMDTSRDGEDPDRAIARRWRHLRTTLRTQGADEATLKALDAAVGTDRDIPGRHGQALFATHGHLALTVGLPDPPEHDTARFGALADLLPVALAHAPDIPYLAVVLTRGDPAAAAGTDGRPDGAGEVHVAGEAGRWPAGRLAPGQRLTRRLPVRDWPHEAAQVACDLVDLADGRHAEVVVVCRDDGAPRLADALIDRLPIHLRNSLTLIDCDEHGPDVPHVMDAGDATGTHACGGTDTGDGVAAHGCPARRALAESHLAQVLDGGLSREDERFVDVFFTQRARHRSRSEGTAAVVRALRRRQAQAVLLSTPLKLPEHLWFDQRSGRIALTGDEAASLGMTDAQPQPAASALLYATVRTGAELVVLPPDETLLTDGVGVVLRYRDVTDMNLL